MTSPLRAKRSWPHFFCCLATLFLSCALLLLLLFACDVVQGQSGALPLPSTANFSLDPFTNLLYIHDPALLSDAAAAASGSSSARSGDPMRTSSLVAVNSLEVTPQSLLATALYLCSSAREEAQRNSSGNTRSTFVPMGVDNRDRDRVRIFNWSNFSKSPIHYSSSAKLVSENDQEVWWFPPPPPSAATNTSGGAASLSQRRFLCDASKVAAWTVSFRYPATFQVRYVSHFACQNSSLIRSSSIVPGNGTACGTLAKNHLPLLLFNLTRDCTVRTNVGSSASWENYIGLTCDGFQTQKERFKRNKMLREKQQQQESSTPSVDSNSTSRSHPPPPEEDFDLTPVLEGSAFKIFLPGSAFRGSNPDGFRVLFNHINVTTSEQVAKMKVTSIALCRMVGYPLQTQAERDAVVFSSSVVGGTAVNQLLITNLTCSNTSTNLLECDFDMAQGVVSGLSEARALTLYCGQLSRREKWKFRTTVASSSSSGPLASGGGLLLAKAPGVGVTNEVSVCDDYFDLVAARSICKSMGIPSRWPTFGTTATLETRWRVGLDNVVCWMLGPETVPDFDTQCQYKQTTNCNSQENVWLYCPGSTSFELLGGDASNADDDGAATTTTQTNNSNSNNDVSVFACDRAVVRETKGSSLTSWGGTTTSASPTTTAAAGSPSQQQQQESSLLHQICYSAVNPPANLLREPYADIVSMCNFIVGRGNASRIFWWHTPSLLNAVPGGRSVSNSVVTAVSCPRSTTTDPSNCKVTIADSAVTHCPLTLALSCAGGLQQEQQQQQRDKVVRLWPELTPSVSTSGANVLYLGAGVADDDHHHIFRSSTATTPTTTNTNTNITLPSICISAQRSLSLAAPATPIDITTANVLCSMMGFEKALNVSVSSVQPQPIKIRTASSSLSSKRIIYNFSCPASAVSIEDDCTFEMFPVLPEGVGASVFDLPVYCFEQVLECGSSFSASPSSSEERRRRRSDDGTSAVPSSPKFLHNKLGVGTELGIVSVQFPGWPWPRPVCELDWKLARTICSSSSSDNFGFPLPFVAASFQSSATAGLPTVVSSYQNIVALEDCPSTFSSPPASSSSSSTTTWTNDNKKHNNTLVDLRNCMYTISPPDTCQLVTGQSSTTVDTTNLLTYAYPTKLTCHQKHVAFLSIADAGSAAVANSNRRFLLAATNNFTGVETLSYYYRTGAGVGGSNNNNNLTNILHLPPGQNFGFVSSKGFDTTTAYAVCHLELGKNHFMRNGAAPCWKSVSAATMTLSMRTGVFTPPHSQHQTEYQFPSKNLAYWKRLTLTSLTCPTRAPSDISECNYTLAKDFGIATTDDAGSLTADTSVVELHCFPPFYSKTTSSNLKCDYGFEFSLTPVSGTKYSAPIVVAKTTAGSWNQEGYICADTQFRVTSAKMLCAAMNATLQPTISFWAVDPPPPPTSTTTSGDHGGGGEQQKPSIVLSKLVCPVGAKHIEQCSFSTDTSQPREVFCPSGKVVALQCRVPLIPMPEALYVANMSRSARAFSRGGGGEPIMLTAPYLSSVQEKINVPFNFSRRLVAHPLAAITGERLCSKMGYQFASIGKISVAELRLINANSSFSQSTGDAGGLINFSPPFFAGVFCYYITLSGGVQKLNCAYDLVSRTSDVATLSCYNTELSQFSKRKELETNSSTASGGDDSNNVDVINNDLSPQEEALLNGAVMIRRKFRNGTADRGFVCGNISLAGAAAVCTSMLNAEEGRFAYQGLLFSSFLERDESHVFFPFPVSMLMPSKTTTTKPVRVFETQALCDAGAVEYCGTLSTVVPPNGGYCYEVAGVSCSRNSSLSVNLSTVLEVTTEEVVEDDVGATTTTRTTKKNVRVVLASALDKFEAARRAPDTAQPVMQLPVCVEVPHQTIFSDAAARFWLDTLSSASSSSSAVEMESNNNNIADAVCPSSSLPSELPATTKNVPVVVLSAARPRLRSSSSSSSSASSSRSSSSNDLKHILASSSSSILPTKEAFSISMRRLQNTSSLLLSSKKSSSTSALSCEKSSDHSLVEGVCRGAVPSTVVGEEDCDHFLSVQCGVPTLVSEWIIDLRHDGQVAICPKNRTSNTNNNGISSSSTTPFSYVCGGLCIPPSSASSSSVVSSSSSEFNETQYLIQTGQQLAQDICNIFYVQRHPAEKNATFFDLSSTATSLNTQQPLADDFDSVFDPFAGFVETAPETVSPPLLKSSDQELGRDDGDLPFVGTHFVEAVEGISAPFFSGGCANFSASSSSCNVPHPISTAACRYPDSGRLVVFCSAPVFALRAPPPAAPSSTIFIGKDVHYSTSIAGTSSSSAGSSRMNHYIAMKTFQSSSSQELSSAGNTKRFVENAGQLLTVAPSSPSSSSSSSSSETMSPVLVPVCAFSDRSSATSSSSSSSSSFSSSSFLFDAAAGQLCCSMVFGHSLSTHECSGKFRRKLAGPSSNSPSNNQNSSSATFAFRLHVAPNIKSHVNGNNNNNNNNSTSRPNTAVNVASARLFVTQIHSSSATEYEACTENFLELINCSWTLRRNDDDANADRAAADAARRRLIAIVVPSVIVPLLILILVVVCFVLPAWRRRKNKDNETAHEIEMQKNIAQDSKTLSLLVADSLQQNQTSADTAGMSELLMMGGAGAPAGREEADSSRSGVRRRRKEKNVDNDDDDGESSQQEYHQGNDADDDGEQQQQQHAHIDMSASNNMHSSPDLSAVLAALTRGRSGGGAASEKQEDSITSEPPPPPPHDCEDGEDEERARVCSDSSSAYHAKYGAATGGDASSSSSADGAASSSSYVPMTMDDL